MVAPTIPPTKPHFFKPLLPGFHHKLLIPISFFKYLNGQKCEHVVVLRTGMGKWIVKVNGRRLEDGWTDFAKSHDLRVGDFLVFRHEGDMVFDVTAFKPSGCKREYTESPTILDISDVEESSSDSDSIKEYSTGSEKFFNDPSMARPKAEASDPFTHGSHPSFVSTLTRYSLESSVLYIPVKFAKQNGLINRRCEMILRCQQRSWQVTLSKKSDGTEVYIRHGWRDFCIANGLKAGDNFRIELTKNGQVPIMDFHRLKGRSRDKARSSLVSSSSSGPYFIGRFGKNSLKWSVMNIPKKFARSNDLINKCCKIVIIDSKGKQWLMSLKHKPLSRAIYIRGRWRQFAKSNDLKEGDTFKLQLVKGLTSTLTMNFYVVASHEKGLMRSHKLADQNRMKYRFKM